MTLVTGTIKKFVDYGLGTFGPEFKPIVITAFSSDVYHRHDHGGRLAAVTTWTEDFVRDENQMRRCKVCWPQTRTENT